VHRMLERVQEQYTKLTRRPRTLARISTTTRRRVPPPPRPRSPPPSPPRLPSSPVYSPSKPERYPPPTAPEEFQPFVVTERAPTPPPPFQLEHEPAPLVDETKVEFPRSPSPEIPTSPRARWSRVRHHLSHGDLPGDHLPLRGVDILEPDNPPPS
jgi:hypothetical protein